MELTDFVAIGAICVFISAILSYLTVHLLLLKREYRLTEVETKVESLLKARYADMSVEKRNENKEAKQAFMAQAGAIMQGEGEMGDKIKKIIALDPELALKMVSKLGVKL